MEKLNHESSLDSQTNNLLFEPLSIGSCKIPGRIIKTATAETMATADGFVTDELVELYEMYASGSN
jgi:2,4-dienoyl-CoA reductase-like NADH-dependent reductase (Old Yellow Enzyme family)